MAIHAEQANRNMRWKSYKRFTAAEIEAHIDWCFSRPIQGFCPYEKPPVGYREEPRSPYENQVYYIELSNPGYVTKRVVALLNARYRRADWESVTLMPMAINARTHNRVLRLSTKSGLCL